MDRRSFLKLIPFAAPMAKLEVIANPVVPKLDPDEILTRSEIIVDNEGNPTTKIVWTQRRSACYPGRWFNSRGELVEITSHTIDL